MFIPDDEKEGRKEALQKLMDLMGQETGKKLGDLKKPVAASMTIEKLPSDMDDDYGSDDDEKDMSGMGDDDGDEPSEDEKAKIAELYHKYC